MTTIYFRLQHNGISRRLFTPSTAPTAMIEDMIIQEVRKDVQHPGVYRIRLEPATESSRSVGVHKLTDAESMVALLLATHREDGSIHIEQSHIDEYSSAPSRQAAQESLAEAAAFQIKELPVNQPTWIFVSLA